MADMRAAQYCEIVTPDLVRVRYEVAGIGSRIVGLVIDQMILSSVVGAIVIVVLVTFFGFVENLVEGIFGKGGEDAVTTLAGFIFASTMLFYFTVWALYHVIFETRRNGRTPGKRAAGTQVIKLDGTALSLRTSILRNVFRMIDSLPLLYIAGGIYHLVNKYGQRLGDYAAGTIVVRVAGSSYLDRGPARGSNADTSARESQEIQAWTSDAGLLDLADLEIIHNFLGRHDTLTADKREEIADMIAHRLAEKYGYSIEGFKDRAVDFLKLLVNG